MLPLSTLCLNCTSHPTALTYLPPNLTPLSTQTFKRLALDAGSMMMLSTILSASGVPSQALLLDPACFSRLNVFLSKKPVLPVRHYSWTQLFFAAKCLFIKKTCAPKSGVLTKAEEDKFESWCHKTIVSGGVFPHAIV
jgi:hypothetical protein